MSSSRKTRPRKCPVNGGSPVTDVRPFMQWNERPMFDFRYYEGGRPEAASDKRARGRRTADQVGERPTSRSRGYSAGPDELPGVTTRLRP